MDRQPNFQPSFALNQEGGGHRADSTNSNSSD